MNEDNKHGYKAYNPGLVCRGYQYKENEVFKKNGHGICVHGVTHAKIGSSGDYARIGSSGDYARIGSSGYYAQIGSSGYSAQIGSSGYSAQIGSSGDYARIGSSGYSAKIGSSGYSAKIDISGADSVGAAIGINSKIKAALGNWITLAEWKYDGEKQRYVPLCVKSAKIDGEKLKPDTWYILKDGEFVED